MNKETTYIFKKDIKNIAIILIVFFIFLKVHYYKESIFVLIKLLLTNAFLFIIPGYCLMLYYLDDLDFVNRFIIGLGLGYGVQPLILYLINVIIEVNILKYNYYVSLMMILVGIFLFYLKSKR